MTLQLWLIVALLFGISWAIVAIYETLKSIRNFLADSHRLLVKIEGTLTMTGMNLKGISDSNLEEMQELLQNIDSKLNAIETRARGERAAT